MNRHRSVAAIVLASMLLFGGRAVSGQPAGDIGLIGAGGNDEISINFDNAPVIEVIDVMSRVTRKNFVIDPTVKGSVTVIAPTRIPKSEAYSVFESILEMNGFSLVPLGSIIKVVPSRSAAQKSIPVRKGRETEGDGGRDKRAVEWGTLSGGRDGPARCYEMLRKVCAQDCLRFLSAGPVKG